MRCVKGRCFKAGRILRSLPESKLREMQCRVTSPAVSGDATSARCGRRRAIKAGRSMPLGQAGSRGHN